MRRSLHRAAAVLVASILAGCVGIAHTLVTVAPLRARLDGSDAWAASGRNIYVVRPAFYGEGTAFVALVKESVVSDVPVTDWRAVSTTMNQPLVAEFPEEKRYIDFPVLLIPLPPRPETR